MFKCILLLTVPCMLSRFSNLPINLLNVCQFYYSSLLNMTNNDIYVPGSN